MLAPVLGELCEDEPQPLNQNGCRRSQFPCGLERQDRIVEVVSGVQVHPAEGVTAEVPGGEVVVVALDAGVRFLEQLLELLFCRRVACLSGRECE